MVAAVTIAWVTSSRWTGQQMFSLHIVRACSLRLCEWDVPDRKSLPSSQMIEALAQVNMQPLP